MTIEATTTEQARPDSTVTDPLLPAEGASQTPVVTDPDELELQAAKAAAQAEDTAAKPEGAEGAVTADGKTPAQPTTTTTGAKPAAQAAGPMIPKARFDEVLTGKSKAEQEAAYWRGRAEASGTAAPGTGQQQQQQQQPQTPEQRIAAVRTEKAALAKEFDDGNLSMADYEARRDALDDKVTGIREEALLTKVRPAGDTKSSNDELFLDSKTAELEDSHPWVHIFDQVGKAHWPLIETQARENLAERGVEIKGSIGTYHLREEMAKLADEIGPALLATKATAKGIALPGQTQDTAATKPPQQQQQKELSPEAKARLAKLDQHRQAPPNLNNMSGSSVNEDVLSDARVETMSEADYDKLPKATRDKLLGISA